MVVTAYAAKISDRRSEVNCPLTFEARPYLQVSRTWGQGGDNIVGGDGSANTLEFKLPNWLVGYGVFDRHQNTRANQNLTGLGFVAKPGCAATASFSCSTSSLSKAVSRPLAGGS